MDQFTGAEINFQFLRKFLLPPALATLLCVVLMLFPCRYLSGIRWLWNDRQTPRSSIDSQSILVLYVTVSDLKVLMGSSSNAARLFMDCRFLAVATQYCEKYVFNCHFRNSSGNEYWNRDPFNVLDSSAELSFLVWIDNYGLGCLIWCSQQSV